jgi:cytochrome c553
MIAKKMAYKLFCALLLLLGGVVVFAKSQVNNSVTIESMESKTTSGHPVYNTIKFYASKDQDTWVMLQSHDGIKHPIEEWDQIKITVDKKARPYQVSYHQYKDGKEIELKASCYTCHSNGPRAIRPNYDSMDVNYNVKAKLNVAWMNLQIKMYGKSKIKISNYKLNGAYRKVPLKYFGKADTETLKVKTCTYCHKADGLMARGELQRQHITTISHLTKTHQMPPWPFKLSKAEQKELSKFLKGF